MQEIAFESTKLFKKSIDKKLAHFASTTLDTEILWHESLLCFVRFYFSAFFSLAKKTSWAIYCQWFWWFSWYFFRLNSKKFWNSYALKFCKTFRLNELKLVLGYFSKHFALIASESHWVNSRMKMNIILCGPFFILDGFIWTWNDKSWFVFHFPHSG